MTSLKQQINDDVKAAMRDKARDRLGVLRMINAAIKQKEVDERIELDDTGVLAVLDKMAKQHRDSIDQYQEAGRNDLVDKETFELEIVQSYLPSALDDSELEEMVMTAIADSGAVSMQDMGRVMGLLKPKVQGRADMSRVSSLVKSHLG